MKPRPVLINTTEKSHLVRYADRKPGQRHCAAQFDARYSSVQFVKDWIANNPKIHLVENETHQH
jgi:hypothetical protein